MAIRVETLLSRSRSIIDEILDANPHLIVGQDRFAVTRRVQQGLRQLFLQTAKPGPTGAMRGDMPTDVVLRGQIDSTLRNIARSTGILEDPAALALKEIAPAAAPVPAPVAGGLASPPPAAPVVDAVTYPVSAAEGVRAELGTGGVASTSTSALRTAAGEAAARGGPTVKVVRGVASAGGTGPTGLLATKGYSAFYAKATRGGTNFLAGMIPKPNSAVGRGIQLAVKNPGAFPLLFILPAIIQQILDATVTRPLEKDVARGQVEAQSLAAPDVKTQLMAAMLQREQDTNAAVQQQAMQVDLSLAAGDQGGQEQPQSGVSFREAI